MTETLFSRSWYSIEAIRFKLRSHVTIHRHTYRGEIWFVLQDHVTGQFHRFTPGVYQVIGRLNGEKTLQEVWQLACDKLDEDMPTQNQLITLISKLYNANILTADVVPNISELNSRYRTIIRNRFLQRIKSPLGIRVPLFDPDKFLNRTIDWFSPIFSFSGFFIWFFVLVSALILMVLNWPELSMNTSDRVLALENIFLMALVYPVVKTIHEFGHAYVLKKWGAEVHEMGIMFLVFFPVPYVEASEAISFSSKHQRMLVGAVGVMIEVFLASLAMILWSFIEPGAVRSLAFNIMIVAGISTLLFNGNPLLKFDAYYVLSDYLEIPNLSSKGNAYWAYIVKTKLFKIKKIVSPSSSTRESYWLFFYALASFLYRAFVMIMIAIYIASQFYFIGVLIAIWSIYMSLIKPFFKVISAPFTDSSFLQNRLRTNLTFGFLFLALTAGLFFIRIPFSTNVQGVLLGDELGYIRAGQSGFVIELLAAPGMPVDRGEVLLKMADPDLSAEIEVLASQIMEVEQRLQASFNNINQAEIISQELIYLQNELSLSKQRQALLTIKSPQDGIYELPNQYLLGKFFNKGDIIGQVVNYKTAKVNVLVDEDSIESVLQNTLSIEVRMVSSITEVYYGTIDRVSPASSQEFPSSILSVGGGGDIASDPTSTSELLTFGRFFHLDIVLPDAPKRRLEERVYVLFKHPPEPAYKRIYRSIRRVFLRYLNV